LKGAQSLKTRLSDDLNLPKYGATYKKLLVTLEDIYHLVMISTIKDGGQDGRVGELNDKTSKKLETMQKAIEALSSIDEFLTHHKS